MERKLQKFMGFLGASASLRALFVSYLMFKIDGKAMVVI